MLLNSCHFWKERKRKEKKEGGRKGRAFHDSATQKRNVQPYKKSHCYGPSPRTSSKP